MTPSSMTERERQTLFLRFAEIDAQLADLTQGRVVEGDPVEFRVTPSYCC